MKENNQQIKLQKMKLKIIDELQIDGNLRQLATGKPASEITYDGKDFMKAGEKFPEDHQEFTGIELIKFYNEFHQEMNEYYGNK